MFLPNKDEAPHGIVALSSLKDHLCKRKISSRNDQVNYDMMKHCIINKILVD